MAVRAVQRQVVTERLAGHLLASGLSRTSVRQLAAAAQVSDRMLLYYFRDKAEALGGQVTAGFLSWIETRLDIEDAERRHAIAGLILAAVDGLALLEIGAGAERAAAAAERAQDVRFTP